MVIVGPEKPKDMQVAVLIEVGVDNATSAAGTEPNICSSFI